MIKSERIAKKINKRIKIWVEDRAKLIVAIDGYAGSGKTTIADFIAKQNPDVLSVHLDDFVHHWKDRKRMINEAKNKPRVFECDWYRYGDLEKLIKKFKTKKEATAKIKAYDYDKNDFGSPKTFDISKKILVVEGNFLLHPLHKISKLWNKTVYLDIDFARADKRRISREKKKWGKRYVPETHPDNWTKYYKESYRKYIKQHKPFKKCDLGFKL
ncbi:MAG: hypothetical protein WA093_02165 [Minisyncoccales bacterium]